MRTRRRLKNYLNQVKDFISSWRKLLGVLFPTIIALMLIPVIVHIVISNSFSDKTFSDVNSVPDSKVAIVFGAAVWSGKPSPMLEDRVMVAVDLYKAGKVEKIIMSGDNRTLDYDEPSAMIEMAKEQGIPEVVLQPDYAGRRTYDTCIRAKQIFNVDEAVLVTQSFHMDRALYTCNSLGIDSVGVLADKHDYDDTLRYQLRDHLALLKAIWEINIDGPDDVVLGDVIEI